MEAHEREQLRAIADYQFGAGAGPALFPGDQSLTLRRSASGRIRQVGTGTDRLVSVGTDGRLTLGVRGGARLIEALDTPRTRVVVGDESAPYVRDGRSVFAKFVQDVDPAVRARDEVAVVHSDGTLLGVGRAELSAAAMQACQTGAAVSTRAGVDPERSGERPAEEGS
ncbi:MAG: PUA domain-containing protein [Halobacteriaceae archaeon]